MNKKKFLYREIISLLLILVCSQIPSKAADFIVPTSSGEPITIDVSSLNLLQEIDVTVGEFTDQPRPYRDANTSKLVIIPPPADASEKTITVRAGGSSISKTVSYRQSPQGTLKLSRLPKLEDARGSATATKLSDGRVVIIGGSNSLTSTPVTTLEIFNPQLANIELLKQPGNIKNAKLVSPRGSHTATYLGINDSPVGKITGPVEQILIVGGFANNGTILNSIEILEIKIGTNEAVSTAFRDKKSKLKEKRLFHTANLLPDGRVIIIGGQGKINQTNVGALNSIEIFNPSTKRIEIPSITLSTPRLLHTATTLQNGNILIAGGYTNDEEDSFGIGEATSTAELINIRNLTIKDTGELVNENGLGGHSATLLTNGLVLLTGGSEEFFTAKAGEKPSKGLTKGTIQYFNPQTEKFAEVKDISADSKIELQTSRYLHNSILLPSGEVAIIGGSNIKKGSSGTVINTPVDTIEIFDLSSSTDLLASLSSVIKTATGRISPISTLVAPKIKTEGLLSSSDSSSLTNTGVFITGGFRGGFGDSPSDESEFIQIDQNTNIEGRKVLTDPTGIITGGYVSDYKISLDTFSEVPTLVLNPQILNLSSSNDFMSKVIVFSTNGESVLLKAETDSSIVVSPTLFQSGEQVSISRANSSVTGEFNISFKPVNSTETFVGGNLKVNVSESAKPFLSTNPSSGISLSTLEGSNSQKVSLKVFSQDGTSEITSIPSSTMVTATISDSSVANLGGVGTSLVSGTLSTEFNVVAVKPGSVTLTFTIDFPDVLPVSIPVQVKGIPTFTNEPIDPTVLTGLELNGVEFSGVELSEDSTEVTIKDLRVSSSKNLFPLYVPVNLKNSVDGSSLSGKFTLRPLFGVDLFTSTPRTIINEDGDNFKSQETSGFSVLGGIASNINVQPIVAVATSDGIKTLSYDSDIETNISDSFSKLSSINNISQIEFFETNKNPKIVTLEKENLRVINPFTGEIEATAMLSRSGTQLKLTLVEDQVAAVVSVGEKGIDLVFPLTDVSPRVVNFQLSGDVENITIVDKIGDEQGPFAIAYNKLNSILIVNLNKIPSEIKSIAVDKKRFSDIDYAGRHSVNGEVVDVLVVAAGKEISFFDLKNLKLIKSVLTKSVKSGIRDLVVIDGIIYLSQGSKGILGFRIDSLLKLSEGSEAKDIIEFKENRFITTGDNGIQDIKIKTLNSTKLAVSKPFLLSSGLNNELTVIKVLP